MGLQSLNKKGKRKRILVVVVEKRCRENRLLIYIIPKCYHFNVVVLVFKVAFFTSFLSSKMKRIFYLERGKKG